MAQPSQVQMMRAAIVEELHDFTRQTAEALGQRYAELGRSNPYEAVLLEHDGQCSGAAPSGTPGMAPRG